MKPPIFIIGNPRSGTTLLRLMVASHPGIVVPPECGFLIWWREKYGDWKSADADGVRLEEFLRDLAASKKIETWALDYAALAAAIRAVRPANYAALGSLVYAAFAKQHKPEFQRWGDKNNFHVKHVATLHALLPDACFVHIIRDGRDVACSYRQLARAKIQSAYAPKLPVDIAAIAEEWRTNLETVRRDFAALPAAQKHELRYEDLVRQPEATLRGLCAAIGETFDPLMLEYHQLNRRDKMEPGEFLQWKAKTLEAPDASDLGKFRTELPPEDIAAFGKIAGDLLRAYRYDCP